MYAQTRSDRVIPPVKSGSSLLFFFFQAEDGIRDYKVTGVQTCALPIYDPLPHAPAELVRVAAGSTFGGADADSTHGPDRASPRGAAMNSVVRSHDLRDRKSVV